MNKSKKNLLIVIASIVAVIALLAIAVGILEHIEQKKAEKQAQEELVVDYDFYPADFTRNILEEEGYQKIMQDGFLRYCDFYATNETIGISSETASNYGEEVGFLVDYLYTIIKGDHTAYNDCFSEEYYQSGQPKKDAFTMQQLKNILLTKISQENVTENGENYTKFIYCVEYQINENNGTFRKDIGDGSRPQYLVITNRSGTWKIDAVTIITGKAS